MGKYLTAAETAVLRARRENPTVEGNPPNTKSAGLTTQFLHESKWTQWPKRVETPTEEKRYYKGTVWKTPHREVGTRVFRTKGNPYTPK